MHRTQVSTPLSKGSSHCRKASEGYHPSYSNWLQDAANAPARPLFYGIIAELSMLVNLGGNQTSSKMKKDQAIVPDPYISSYYYLINGQG